MGSIKKIGNDYFIEFYARGLKYQQKVGPGKEEAVRALKEIEEKIARGEAALIVRDVDIDIFLEDFIGEAALMHTPKTCLRFQSLSKHFLDFLRQRHPQLEKLSQISPSIVEDYKVYLSKIHDARGRPLKAGAVNLSLILLREIFGYAIKLSYLNDDPGLHVGLLVPGTPGRQPSAPAAQKSYAQAAQALSKGVTWGRLYGLLGYDDIARVVRFVPLIPKMNLGAIYTVE